MQSDPRETNEEETDRNKEPEKREKQKMIFFF